MTESTMNDIIVFDFDGTITTADTFALFLRYYSGTWVWSLKMLSLLPSFALYGLRIIDRNAVKRHVIRRFFKNAPVERLNNKAATFARDVIPGLIRSQAMTEIEAQKRGPYTLYICSASIAPYLRVWGADNGITNILATELKQQDGHYTGDIEGWNIWGKGKTRRIFAEFDPHPVTIHAAYGDSRGDKELLHAAKASFWKPFRL